MMKTAAPVLFIIHPSSLAENAARDILTIGA